VDDPSFLLPGALAWRPAPTVPHPHPGWILVCHLTDIECFPLVASHAERIPAWIPLVIAAPPTLIPALESGLRLFDLARHGLTTVLPHAASAPPHPDLVLDAINTGAVPTVPVLAGWIATRLGRPDDLSLLQTAMAPPGASTRHRRTVQRTVYKKLACHPSDLRRLVRLARQQRLAPSASRLAHLAGTTEGRLRLLVRTLLGVSLSFYNLHPGWERVLEAACRLPPAARGWGLGAGGWGLGADRR